MVRPEAIIFTGLQGSGKSTFYSQRFSETHTWINLDSLKTRFQENKLLAECFKEKRSFVIDNTNPTVTERAKYLKPALLAGYEVEAYYFATEFNLCFERNRSRSGKERIPDVGLYRTRKIMTSPTYEEGFHKIYIVNLTAGGVFDVQQKSR